MTTPRTVKVFIAGEGGVGKTTLIERYIKGTFNPSTILTIGVNHSVITIKSKQNQFYTLQIWDLGGEDRFRFVLPVYIKGSEVGILAFDTTRYSTFRNLDMWLKLIQENAPNVPIILIGTKMDLEDPHNRNLNNIKSFADEHQIAGVFLTSSKTGENISSVFQKVLDLIENKK